MLIQREIVSDLCRTKINSLLPLGSLTRLSVHTVEEDEDSLVIDGEFVSPGTKPWFATTVRRGGTTDTALLVDITASSFVKMYVKHLQGRLTR